NIFLNSQRPDDAGPRSTSRARSPLCRRREVKPPLRPHQDLASSRSPLSQRQQFDQAYRWNRPPRTRTTQIHATIRARCVFLWRGGASELTRVMAWGVWWSIYYIFSLCRIIQGIVGQRQPRLKRGQFVLRKFAQLALQKRSIDLLKPTA